jgi:hypothetical protein
MDKLQHLLETAFGQPEAKRPPLEPNEWTVERQRSPAQSAPSAQHSDKLRSIADPFRGVLQS